MLRLASFVCCLLLSCEHVLAAAPLQVAFGETDITPNVRSERPVWMAGYAPGRRAAGVHDPLFARAVVLQSGEQTLAFVSLDVIGLQYPTVRRIRKKLSDLTYVMVSSTHNHEGPDTIGIWGRTFFTTGVDPEYLASVVDRVAGLVRRTQRQLAPVRASYGTAQDETLLGDSRLPKAFDGVLRVLKFTRADDGRTQGVLVQWNCHPEAMGSKNKLVTADFPAATVAQLKRQYQAPVAYFSGAVGGLMAPPDGIFQDSAGKVLQDGDFAYAEAYGRAVADLAAKALEQSAPIELTPFAISAKPVALPLFNPVYKLARSLNVIHREGRVWTGDAEAPGAVLPQGKSAKDVAVETEVACLRLGALHVACIPGELYPELVYGKFQNPAEPAADFPNAPLEKPVNRILPDSKFLLFGLANDEVGYIIPKRQWDQLPPFAYGRDRSQYGEINSVGPEVAPIIMRALENRVRDLAPANGR